MSSLTALVIVNIVLWLGIGGYLAFVAWQQKSLQKKLDMYTTRKEQFLS